MEKELNSQKIKLEINSLEHLLLENVVERESTQIKGGCGGGSGLHDSSSPLTDFDFTHINHFDLQPLGLASFD